MRLRIAAFVLALSIIGLPREVGPAAASRLELVSEAGTIVWVEPAAGGEEFDVSFLHSQEGCLWTQHYQVGPAGGIEQVGTLFPCFGAGMPLGGVAPLERTPLGYLVRMHAHLGDIPMMSWRASAITLRHRGRAVRIADFFDDFDRFTIRVR